MPVVAQHRHNGELCMVAYANQEALERTLATRTAHFFSRSRQALWQKGETSGNVLHIAEVWTDCDADTLVYLVDPTGPSCHTGKRQCFFNRLDTDHQSSQDQPFASPTLVRLEDILAARTQRSATKSYTRSLLERGVETINAKIREEAEELTQALAHESDERVDSETADLLYHSLVGLMARQRSLSDVAQVLATRFGQSGHAEKASRQGT